MHEILERKLLAVRQQRMPLVEPWRVIDLTSPIGNPRVAFPYDATPPFQVLNREELAKAFCV